MQDICFERKKPVFTQERESERGQKTFNSSEINAHIGSLSLSCISFTHTVVSFSAIVRTVTQRLLFLVGERPHCDTKIWACYACKSYFCCMGRLRSDNLCNWCFPFVKNKSMNFKSTKTSHYFTLT